MAWTQGDHNLEQAIRTGDFTGELIVDPESPLENLFSLPMMAGVLTVMACGSYLVLAAFGAVSGAETKANAWSYLIKGIFLTVVGYFIRSLVDVHYRFNLDERSITLYRRFLNREFRRKICNFSDVDSLYIDSTSTRVKDPGYSDETYVNEYSYGLKMYLKKGSSIRLLDRSYEDYDRLRQRVGLVAEYLGVRVGGEQGSPNRGSSSISGGGCLKGCGVLLALMMLGVFTTANKQNKTPAPAPSSIETVEPTVQSQRLFVNKLKSFGFLYSATYFQSKLIQIDAGPEVWKEIFVSQPQTPSKISDSNLFVALAQSPRVVEMMAHKLELSKPVERETDPRRFELWETKISLRVEMLFPPPRREAIPMLGRNLELGFLRMAKGSPREGQARLTLKVLPKLAKPFVQAEKDGFTLHIPSDRPIAPADLGLDDRDLKK